jgi:hypothetical protein
MSSVVAVAARDIGRSVDLESVKAAYSLRPILHDPQRVDGPETLVSSWSRVQMCLRKAHQTHVNAANAVGAEKPSVPSI